MLLHHCAGVEMLGNYNVNMPYPEVSGGVSERTLMDLYDLYAGRTSEMTAVTTYVYQHVLTEKDYAEIAELLGGIGMVEMKHIELLASAINAFGGDPVFAGRYNWFSGSYTDYEKDLKQMLVRDVEAEKAAANAYIKVAENTDNQSLKQLLTRISMDEELHVALLTAALERLE